MSPTSLEYAGTSGIRDFFFFFAFTFGTFTIIIIKNFGLFDFFFFLAEVFIPIIGWHFRAHLSQC